MSTLPFCTSWTRMRPKPPDVAKKVASFLKPYRVRPTDPSYEEAVAKARRDYTISKVNPFHINDSMRHFQNTHTSPGLPFTTMGYKRKDEVEPEIIRHYVHRLKTGLWSKCIHPCNAVCRSMVGRKPKCRLIWVYPAHMIFAEGMFAQPLINAYIAKRGSYALWSQFSKGHMAMFQTRLPPGKQWLGTDYSAYDSTIPPWLIRDAFAILKDQIDFSRYAGYGWPQDKLSLHRLWRSIVNYFINTPVKLPSGRVLVKHGGVPSGSYFTSLVDSVCNSIITHYMLKDVDYSTQAKWELGDDSLVAVDEKFTLDGFARRAKEVFGVIVNTDKTELGKYVSFLGYKMSPTMTPMANYQKLMAQLCLPDRPDKTLQDTITRVKALQLSCFGKGCLHFVYETQAWLETIGAVDIPPKLHKRSELRSKLEAMDLASFPPLTKVMQLV